MNQKKIRKLLRDPKLFFKDMLHKRLPKKSSVAPTLVKKKGNYSYSVVAAVYGVEKYLDDFFKSLVNQSLDFKTHIQLVMVDDDSPDASAEIIKKWQKKYPENIVYLKKNNGGQASARNLGLDYATGEWLAFIDPDDFLDTDYFYEVDKHISKQKNEIIFVSCNTIFYHENKNQFSDTHPLNYRFRKESVVQVSHKNIFYQLSASSVFFNSSKIRMHGMKFYEDIKPNFEDGEFVSRLLLLEMGGYISYLPSAKYYYRKRSDGTSTLDTSFLDERRYSQLIDNGYLRLLSKCQENHGSVPLWLQSTMLYELIWIIKSVLSNGHKLNFLSAENKENYINKIKTVASYIDNDLILSYSLAGCWFFHKVGILGFLKNTRPEFSIAYAENWDDSRELFCIKYYWCGELPEESVFVGEKEVFPIYAKNRHHDFFGHEFVCERILWISLPKTPEELSLKLNEIPARLSIKGKQFASGVKCEEAIDLMKKNEIDLKKINTLAKTVRSAAKNFDNQKKFKNAWIFMDRDTMADDNAEHLYRYVKNNHSKVNAFFVLRKNSPDWPRLEKEGFKLLDFESDEHRIALLNADFLLSSHADTYVLDLLSKKDYGDMLKYKYIFLQHGVIKDDLSKWLNTKDMSLFLTATNDEYESIVADNTKYKFGRNTVSLTGLPRHDNLIQLSDVVPKSGKQNIVIMPTWRSSLMGKNIGSGFQRTYNDEFFESDYAKAWKNLLHSESLRELAEKVDAEIIFYPHANIDIYIDGFDIPDHISIKRNGNGESIQKTFVETDILITDYSSVSFDIAYLKKPVIYYQFDRDQIFSGDHTYEKGYFDYEEDGFGPVCLQLEEVISSLEQYLLYPHGEVWSYYQKVAEKTFEFRDGRCCERAFDAIVRLQQPVIMREEEQNTRLRQTASEALEKGFVSTAINRYRQCFELTNAEQDVKALITLLSRNKSYAEVLKLYEIHGQQWSAETTAQCLVAFVALGCYKYAEDLLDRKIEPEVLFEFSESIMEYSSWKKDGKIYAYALQNINADSIDVADIFKSYLDRDWNALRAKLRFASPEILKKHFGLFLQSCFRTGHVDYAKSVFNSLIEDFEPISKKLYITRIQLAEGDFDAALKSYENLCKTNVESMCGEDIDNWLKIRKYKDVKSPISSNLGIDLLRRFSIDSDICCHVIQQAEFIKNGYFDQVLEIFSKENGNIPSEVALFLFKNLITLNKFQEAENFVKNASFAVMEDSDKVLIQDFKKMNLEMI